MSEPVSRRGVLASLFALAASATATAQQFVRPQRPDGTVPEPQVPSGSDVGFRIEREDSDGAKVGMLVVKVDGKWVEARFGHGLRRGSSQF